MSTNPEPKPSRRALLRTAAWTTPVIATVVAAPPASASSGTTPSLVDLESASSSLNRNGTATLMLHFRPFTEDVIVVSVVKGGTNILPAPVSGAKNVKLTLDGKYYPFGAVTVSWEDANGTVSSKSIAVSK